MEHQRSELLDLAVKEWIEADHEPARSQLDWRC
jgi:hypothetical protein